MGLPPGLRWSLQGGSWLLGLEKASKREPTHFPGSSGHPASAQICEGNLATPHRRQLASHQFHGTTVAQEQVFGLVSSSLFLTECWVAILQ